MVVKTYSISNDVTAGSVNSEKLHIEILTSGYVNNFDGLSITGDVVDILGTSLVDEPSLDTLVLNHDPTPTPNANTGLIHFIITSLGLN